MRLGLISERVSLHAWFPCKAESEKRQLFQSKWSNAFQIQIGIDPRWGVEGRRAGGGGDGGGWADNKGQRRCVLHLFIPPLKETNILWFAVLRSGENGGLDATRTASKHRQTAPASSLQSKDSHYLRGKRQCVCVRGRDAYTSADLERAWPIDRIKLPVKERNQYVFKDEAGCMWCMRVGFIDTTRCIERSHWKDKNDHIWGSRAFTSHIGYFQSLTSSS